MNPQIRKLTEERDRTLAEISKMEAEATISGRPLTDNEKERLDALKWQAGYQGDRIHRLQQMLDDAKVTAQPIDPNITPPPPGGFLNRGGQHRMVTAGTRGEQWAVATFGLGKDGAGFGTMTEFLGVVGSGMMDSRLAVLTAGQKEGSGSTGGFVVPTELLVQPLGVAYEQSVCLSRCDVHPMTSEELKIAGWDASSASGGAFFGGFTPQIVEEGGDMSVQTGQLRSIKLVARKIGLLAKSSNELIDDAGTIPQLMASGLGAAIDFTADYFVLRGSGAAQPLGLLNSPSRIVVDKEGAQVADTVLYSNLAKMFARLHPACYANAVWLAHPSTIPQLEMLTINVGTSGAVYRVLTESNGAPEIMHRPVLFTEKCSSLGDEGDVILCDLSQYALGMRKEVTIEQSRHVYFASDETAWRAIMRMDGQPKWSSAYTPRNGATLSWCVTLQAR